MAIAKGNYPQSYSEARDILDDRTQRKIAHSTTLRRVIGPDGQPAYAVQYHITDIVTFHSDGSVQFDTGGWNSSTTRGRMDLCAPVGWGVCQEDGELVLRHLDSGIAYVPQGSQWRLLKVAGSDSLQPSPDCYRKVSGVLVKDDGVPYILTVLGGEAQLLSVGGTVYLGASEVAGFKGTRDPEALSKIEAAHKIQFKGTTKAKLIERLA